MAKLIREITRFTQPEIDSLFKKARRVLSQDGLTILIGPRQKDFGRVLIMASKKIGNAPTRNKFRRRIKAIFIENNFHHKEWDWIILPRPGITEKSFQDLNYLMLHALKNAS